MKCPCNTEILYKNCCEIAHKDINQVKTAQQLMRSRYSAFVLSNMAYLHKSHHSTTRPSKSENKETEKWTRSVNWIKLEVLNATSGLENDLKGAVEFKAFFEENGLVQVIHEHSTFCKENGHWVYLDAL